MAIVDYFLKIDGIPGESKDDKHKGEVEVHGFAFGSSNTGSSAMGGGAGAGKVQLHELSVSKYIDKSTPKLMEACTTGKHIPSVILSCRKQGGSQQEYMKVTLSDVLISQVSIQGGMTAEDRWERRSVSNSDSGPGNIAETMDDLGASPVPVEQFHMNFSQIDYEYREQDSKGNTKGPVKSGWKVKENKLV